MTQRIFDIENEKDYTDLWDIVPEDIKTIEKSTLNTAIFITNLGFRSSRQYIKINWHNETEITRPIQEATEADIGKTCLFWDNDEDCSKQIGMLTRIKTEKSIFKYVLAESVCFAHCRRLTKQEVEKLI